MSSRERKTDAVAKSMGELLLKGYKMLSTSCEICNNVLLQSKQGETRCIACNEVRDDNGLVPPTSTPLSESDTKVNAKVLTADRGSGDALHVIQSTERMLLTEITSAARYLENLPPATDLQHRQLYIRHIRECAETIQALRSIK